MKSSASNKSGAAAKKDALSRLFLPYQQNWLNDRSRFKIKQKSRRIGGTYEQAFEDVRDCYEGTVPAVYFSTADLTAAKEYIGYCIKWAKVLNVIVEDFGEVVLDEKKDVKSYVIAIKGRKNTRAFF